MSLLRLISGVYSLLPRETLPGEELETSELAPSQLCCIHNRHRVYRGHNASRQLSGVERLHHAFHRRFLRFRRHDSLSVDANFPLAISTQHHVLN